MPPINDSMTWCPTCTTSIPSITFTTHLTSTKHLGRLPWTCPDCSTTLQSRRRARHLSDPTHGGMLPWTCTVCEKTLNIGGKVSHLSSKAHLSRIEWRCQACSIVTTMHHRRKHLLSKPHLQTLVSICQAHPYWYKRGETGGLAAEEIWVCPRCTDSESMDFNAWQRHLSTEKHLREFGAGAAGSPMEDETRGYKDPLKPVPQEVIDRCGQEPKVLPTASKSTGNSSTHLTQDTRTMHRKAPILLQQPRPKVVGLQQPKLMQAQSKAVELERPRALGVQQPKAAEIKQPKQVQLQKPGIVGVHQPKQVQGRKPKEVDMWQPKSTQEPSISHQSHPFSKARTSNSRVHNNHEPKGVQRDDICLPPRDCDEGLGETHFSGHTHQAELRSSATEKLPRNPGRRASDKRWNSYYETTWSCRICNKSGEETNPVHHAMEKAHVWGKQHLQALRAMPPSNSPVVVRIEHLIWTCGRCNISIADTSRASHVCKRPRSPKKSRLAKDAPEESFGSWICVACNTIMNKKARDSHEKEQCHIVNSKNVNIKENRQQGEYIRQRKSQWISNHMEKKIKKQRKLAGARDNKYGRLLRSWNNGWNEMAPVRLQKRVKRPAKGWSAMKAQPKAKNQQQKQKGENTQTKKISEQEKRDKAYQMEIAQWEQSLKEWITQQNKAQQKNTKVHQGEASQYRKDKTPQKDKASQQKKNKHQKGATQQKKQPRPKPYGKGTRTDLRKAAPPTQSIPPELGEETVVVRTNDAFLWELIQMEHRDEWERKDRMEGRRQYSSYSAALGSNRFYVYHEGTILKYARYGRGAGKGRYILERPPCIKGAKGYFWEIGNGW